MTIDQAFLDKIAARLSDSHYIVINVRDGSCGIESDAMEYDYFKNKLLRATPECTFKTLDELYNWVNQSTCKHVETKCNCKEE